MLPVTAIAATISGAFGPMTGKPGRRMSRTILQFATACSGKRCAPPCKRASSGNRSSELSGNQAVSVQRQVTTRPGAGSVPSLRSSRCCRAVITILVRTFSFFANIRCLIIIATLVFTIAGAVCASAATGYPDEISNISVQNVTPTSADIVWDTVHPSNSQVVLARDTNYQGERRINGTDSSLVNHHQVTD